MNSKNKKKSIGKIIGWSVLIIPPLLILIALSINKVHHSYPLAKVLPVSQATKTRAFWFDIDKDKLEKLKQENKIFSYNINHDGNSVTVFDGEYNYEFFIRTRNSSEVPTIYVYPLGDTRGTIIVTFAPHETTVGGVNDYGVLDKTKVDEITKRGLELYNQFIKDYENI